MFANCDSIEENTKYFFYLINRPILVLKCEQGFVGYKGAGSVKLECNKATYETIQVERVENGLVHFKGETESWKFIGTRLIVLRVVNDPRKRQIKLKLGYWPFKSLP